jgi:hypothetical protein
VAQVVVVVAVEHGLLVLAIVVVLGAAWAEALKAV